ncbi:MAG: family 43 glycosylhydrolase [Caulobacterales bacterium]|jgi:beta-xylosidase|nr:family 43 glycosylhydrolase [Caulobacterales bacterium]
MTSRRLFIAGVGAQSFALLSGCASTIAAPLREGELSAAGLDWSQLEWRRGFEGQRRADLGDGTYLNPIFAGDRPDPSIIRDGDTYYMTFSSFDAYPGLLIWASRDLVNWRPINAALRTPIGSVWAPDLCKHDGRYYLYIPARTPQHRSIYVIHAESIEGPWSEPVDLGLPRHIDPCHAVSEDARRFLFLSGGDRVELSADGLSLAGAVEHVYDPWRYPEDWTVESFSPEGPKIRRHGEYFYMITAVGGTAGPPTGHMVIAARARSLHGPWEDCPRNPILRTWSAREKWWSRGHATMIDGPDGGWHLVYHGYENGFWTLGRQTLLEPAEWTDDGWFRPLGGDLSRPLRKPLPRESADHGAALSDDFSTDRLGVQWAFYDPGPNEAARLRRGAFGLGMRGKGTNPGDCSPLAFICGDLSYEIETEIEVDEGAEAGVLLFYNRRLYAGLGFDTRGLVMHRYGLQRRGAAPPGDNARRLFLRLRNDRNIVTIHHSRDGVNWTRYGVQMEVSGYHHNTVGDFLSLRPAIYTAGSGEARFKRVTYRAL